MIRVEIQKANSYHLTEQGSSHRDGISTEITESTETQLAER